MDITNAIGERVSTKYGSLVVTTFLGKGKSGYSYLAQHGDDKYVIKFMHYEHCSYYSFGDANKVDLELSAFNELQRVGVKTPRLLEANSELNFLLKEYVHGDLVTDLITNDILPDYCIEQVFNMAKVLEASGLNIDYFPDNFVVMGDVLYYVDYEINKYDAEWNLSNWGLYYWANTSGMKAYKETKNVLHINQSLDSGVPIKEPFEVKVSAWCKSYQ